MVSPGTTSSPRVGRWSWWRRKVSFKLAQPSANLQDRSLKLLENAKDTGDVILLGQDGIEVPAHSAFLVESPYFKARLSSTWDGCSSWNLNNKLKLRLPFDTSKEGLQILLGFLYIGSRYFLRVGPLDTASMQEVLSLGEACDVPDLCTFLLDLVKVDEGNVQSWLTWLNAERSGNYNFILEQCAVVVCRSFQRISNPTSSIPAQNLLALWELIDRLGCDAKISLIPDCDAEKIKVSSIVLGEAGLQRLPVKIVTELDIQDYIGKTGFFDLMNFQKIGASYLEPNMTIADLKALVATELSIPANLQRYWSWCGRQNMTVRINRAMKDATKIRDLPFRSDAICLFLEAPVLAKAQEHNHLSLPLALPERTPDSALLFVKLYDPREASIRYVGSMFVEVHKKPSEYLQQMKSLAGLQQESRIQIFEEIKFTPTLLCEKVNQGRTFKGLQLEDGDILCIQEEADGLPDVPTFIESLLNSS